MSKARHELIEACGRFCQLVGLPRSLGQIYGLFYLAAQPLSLDDIVEMLGISKGSASTGTRQLAAWGAIRQVWVHGDRRDFFEVQADLGHLLRGGFRDLIKPRLGSSQKRLDHMFEMLDQEWAAGVFTKEEYKLCSERLKNLEKLRKKIAAIAPTAEKWI